MSKTVKTTEQKNTRKVNIAKRDARVEVNKRAEEKGIYALETPSFWKNRPIDKLSMGAIFCVAYLTREENRNKVIDELELRKRFFKECRANGYIGEKGGVIKGKFALSKVEIKQACNWLYFNEQKLFSQAYTSDGTMSVRQMEYIADLIEERKEEPKTEVKSIKKSA